MKISRIYRGKKSNRINIDVDEEFGFSVEEGSLVKFNLFLGKEIDQSEANEIIGHDKYEYLYNKALEHIARRPRSEKELREFLEKKSAKRFKEIELASIDRTIEELKNRKHLDDVEFAKWFADTRMNQRKYSLFQIRSELSMKFGIDREIIDQTLREINEREGEIEAIENLIGKKYGQYKARHKDAHVAKEKMIGYLSSKGFGWEQIKKAMQI